MNIAIVFGGKSVEHDVSIVTAKQIYSVASIKHNVYLVYFDRNDNARLYTNEKFDFKDFKGKNKFLSKIKLENGNIIKDNIFSSKIAKIDCAIMCTHGGNGENGKLEDYLIINGIPVSAGSSVALGISMDKWLSKICLKGLGVPVVPGISVTKYSPEVRSKIENTLGYPVIVKPSGGGSSIGISIAKNAKELDDAFLVASHFDNSFVVEKALEDFTEYNQAVIGQKDDFMLSKIEQPIKKDEILSFKDKYLSNNKKGGLKNSKRSLKINIDKKLENKIKNISAKIFNEVGFYGVIRIDYILDNKNRRLYVNEINAVPGSLGIYFFDELSGIKFVDKLVEIGIENYKNLNKIDKNFITNLF